mmetsp:Transcript_32764/g.80288  ORF Transcript_32764/g.80288 Transcript_32764/m.80288 type:complete len:546 (+) Transcript_32764:186-1823(+)
MRLEFLLATVALLAFILLALPRRGDRLELVSTRVHTLAELVLLLQLCNLVFGVAQLGSALLSADAVQPPVAVGVRVAKVCVVLLRVALAHRGYFVLTMLVEFVTSHTLVQHVCVGAAANGSGECEQYVPIALLTQLVTVLVVGFERPRLGCALAAAHFAHFVAILFYYEVAIVRGNALTPKEMGVSLLVGAFAALAGLSQLVRVLGGRFTTLRRVFARYVSTFVVDELLSNPDGGSLALGGRRVTVTIMLSDLRGFSALIAAMPPEQALSLMNGYLSNMIDIVQRYDGVVDEIIGDALLVVFGLGANTSQRDAARNAVRCACDMQRAMEAHPGLGMGIGVHTGTVVVGNIGSTVRAKFGVIGAAMNMAARLESFALASDVVVSEATQRAVGDFRWQLRARRRVHPKGAPSEGIEIALLVSVEGAHILEDDVGERVDGADWLTSLAQPLHAMVWRLDAPGKSASALGVVSEVTHIGERRGAHYLRLAVGQRHFPADIDVKLAFTGPGILAADSLYAKSVGDDGNTLAVTYAPKAAIDELRVLAART